MPGRKFSSDLYRYGFNGKENDNDVKGEANQQDYGMRIYDPRIGKFLSVDPIGDDYPELTPFQFSSNSPVSLIDQDGLEGVYKLPDGTLFISPYGQSDNLKTPKVPSGARLQGVSPGGDGALQGISTTLDLVPAVGTIKGGIESLIGYDMAGNELSTTDRVLGLIPYVKGVKKAQTVLKVEKEINIAVKTERKIVKTEKTVVSTEKAIVEENATLKRRAGLRKSTKEEVRAVAPKTKDGRYIDPNTKRPIEPGQEVFGHRKGKEWNKYQKDPVNKGKTRKEVLNDQNDPNIYQIEDKRSNASRKYEEKKIK